MATRWLDLVDLGGQKISDDLAGFVLAAHSHRHEFAVSGRVLI